MQIQNKAMYIYNLKGWKSEGGSRKKWKMQRRGWQAKKGKRGDSSLQAQEQYKEKAEAEGGKIR